MAMAPYNNTPESGTRNGRPAGRVTGAGALAGGALFVGLIALCALVISYNGIFQFAEYGGHADSALAHVFPVTYTLLLIMACWVSYLLRGAHPRERLWVDLVLIPILIMVATTAMLLSNLELVERVPEGVASVIVAVAPLAALLVAFLLWMTVRAHIRRRRRAPAPRPRPSDDPTTVLHARAVVPPTREVEEPDDTDLRTRLLHLGSEERNAEAAPAPEDTRAYEVRTDESVESVRLRPVPRPSPDGDGHSGHETPAPDRWDDEPDEDGRQAATVPTALRSVPRPEHDGDGDGDGPSTFPLPRRDRSGHNPIKLAAEHPPVVPGAAAPDPEPDPLPVGAPTEPESRPGDADREDDADGPIVVVANDLADEGFDHEPPPGDPVSDEDEAPAALPEPVEEPAAVHEEAPAPVAVPGAGSATGAVSWSAPGHPGYRDAEYGGADDGFAEDGSHAEDDGPAHGPARVAVSTHPGGETGTWAAPGEDPSGELAAGPVDGSEDDREPGTALWEPPVSADAGDGVLSDYVPPVWTPPEDDGPAFADEEPAEPEPAPVLDHDTGPTVRAAFRIREVPPVAARPSPAWETAETEAETSQGRPTEPEAAPEAGPEVPEDDLLPEVEELPAATDTRTDAGPGTSRPGGEPGQPTGRSQRAPVEKRPMVLKPPRPPMPALRKSAPKPEFPAGRPAPDFTAGPPSRRVRSEPLRPDE
ncbi:DUF2637 domain-containing protein [Nocardiopsis sp. NPDC058631]|uniref:DUF2637 domain-containing protein n=1 Tax=Nocardiopsis sp. NPDC058631 TaxID=3346566 RepID=UPI0036539802